MPIKYSVVIPLYNKGKHINRAIESVLNQTLDDFELIIVDDGSTDDSADQVRHYQDKRITLIQQKNAGVSAARNKGIELATGGFIALLDADDSYTPHFLEKIDALIKRYPDAGMYACHYQFIHPDGTHSKAKINIPNNQEMVLIDDYFFVAATGDLPVTSSSVCIRKSIITDQGGFPINQNMGEDQSLWSKIALNYPMVFSNAVCTHYYLDACNRLCQQIQPYHELPYSAYLQNKLDQREIPNHQITSVKQYIAGHLLDLTRRNLESGQIQQAKTLLKDKRCRQHFLRWIYWNIRCLFA